MKTKTPTEKTPRLVIRKSDVRSVKLIREYFEPILRLVFGTAYIEVIDE